MQLDNWSVYDTCIYYCLNRYVHGQNRPIWQTKGWNKPSSPSRHILRQRMKEDRELAQGEASRKRVGRESKTNPHTVTLGQRVVANKIGMQRLERRITGTKKTTSPAYMFPAFGAL